jgi:hypothetical protein
MIQFDPEHLRIAAKLREQGRRRWRKHTLVFTLICAALIAWPFVLYMLLKPLW